MSREKHLRFTGWTVYLTVRPVQSHPGFPERSPEVFMVAEQSGLGSARERVLEAAERVGTDVGAPRARLASAIVVFSVASIVLLAIDGMKMRESLHISAYTAEQREQIVNELLKLAE